MKCISTSISFTKEYNAVWVGTINAQDYEEKNMNTLPLQYWLFKASGN